MPENLIPLAKAEKRLDLSRTTVWRLRSSGVLPTVHIGRRKFIPKTALDAYIASLRPMPANTPEEH